MAPERRGKNGDPVIRRQAVGTAATTVLEKTAKDEGAGGGCRQLPGAEDTGHRGAIGIGVQARVPSWLCVLEQEQARKAPESGLGLSTEA